MAVSLFFVNITYLAVLGLTAALGIFCCGAQASLQLWDLNSEHGPSSSSAQALPHPCGILVLRPGSNLLPLHWKADSSSLGCQGCPPESISIQSSTKNLTNQDFLKTCLKTQYCKINAFSTLTHLSDGWALSIKMQKRKLLP